MNQSTRWKAPEDMPLRERLAHYTRQTNRCWYWEGHISPKGYGWFNWKGESVLAHRAWWELFNGPLGDQQLDHLCSTRSCVRPSHLEIASQAENVQRGRLAKLTADEVRAIRKAYGSWSEGFPTYAELARQYGVSTATIGRVVTRKTWKNI